MPSAVPKPERATGTTLLPSERDATSRTLERPPPDASITRGDAAAKVDLSGAWTLDRAAEVESLAAAILGRAAGAAEVTFDLSSVERVDTLGAWVLHRTRRDLEARGSTVRLSDTGGRHRPLIEAVGQFHGAPLPPAEPRPYELFVDIGRSVVESGREVVGGLAFLGQSIVALRRVVAHPLRFRLTSLVHQIERIAYRGVPIIALISFLVGGIVAQQGIFQLQKFGATHFAVDLIGILTLRELGVLLTAIMIAGRSGSAFTAEIGSMKMREEIDAIRVMGLDPIDVLILPRLLALLISLPMLTFLADLSALTGGGIVAWLYGGISPEVFTSRLREAIGMNTFVVGLVKAPFMAMIIGLIASIEGFATQGSAESLGRHVTASVVKAIFMVIVVDGLFAMFFAAIEY
jgi:phospholipid/cholesterol/gamma-HCH transport system permease protein